MSMENLLNLLNNPGSCSRPLVMGILNITPDSFHDGGRFFDASNAVKQALALAEAGADIIDIGAASSRPGYTPVSASEESSRLLPILDALKDLALPPLSIDTDKLAVAEAAVGRGVSIINDTSGALDSGCFELAAANELPLIVMHRLRKKADQDIVSEVEAFFELSLEKANISELPERLIIFDPGLGFNKSIGENLQLIDAIPRLARLGRPLLIGYSHKRVAASLTGEHPGYAPKGNAILARRVKDLGAHIVRVHDVKEFLESIKHG